MKNQKVEVVEMEEMVEEGMGETVNRDCNKRHKSQNKQKRIQEKYALSTNLFLHKQLSRTKS